MVTLLSEQEHSPLGGSGYSRWKNCPRSAALSQGAENISSSYADEGTLAHELAYETLVARRDGTEEPDIFGYEDEVVESAMMFVDHMESINLPGSLQLYEHRFHLKEIHPLCFGTADGVTYYPWDKLLIVSDYKHGAGIFVSAKENDQLLYYATGAALSLDLEIERVRIEIVQPRITYAEAIRPWECDYFDLVMFAEQLRQDAKRAEDPNAPLCAGEWCNFCPAAASKCPLLKLKAEVLLTREQLGYADDVETLAEELDYIPILEAAFRRKRELAYKIAERGDKVPGYKLVAKIGRRKWKNEEEAGGAMRLKGLTVEQIHQPAKMKSPAQIEALAVKDIPFSSKQELKDFVNSECDMTSSGHKLVREDVEGKEIIVPTAKTVFRPADEYDLDVLS